MSRAKKQNLDKKTITDQPNGLEEFNETCVGAKDGKFYDLNCEEKLCFGCTLLKNVYFHFRGIGKDQENVELDYILLHHLIYDGSYKFQGLKGLSSIVGRMGLKEWQIVSNVKPEGDVIGSFNESNNFPLGRQNWGQCHKTFFLP